MFTRVLQLIKVLLHILGKENRNLAMVLEKDKEKSGIVSWQKSTCTKVYIKIICEHWYIKRMLCDI